MTLGSDPRIAEQPIDGMTGKRLAVALGTSRAAQAVEIAVVFLVAAVVVSVGWSLVGDDAFRRQVVVWVANVLMLATIRIGLGLRGQTWAGLGLSLGGGLRTLGRTVLQSLVVVVLAVVAFMAAAVVMRNVVAGAPAADASGYDYLQGNLPMLLVALAGVYVVSSFGEEVLYRGFLINRVMGFAGHTRAASGLAILVSAVVFGLAHFDWGIVGVVQTGFMGVVLAVGYVVTRRNLWALVLAHAYMDTLLLVQVYLGPPSP